jgi:hypothetical protein
MSLKLLILAILAFTAFQCIDLIDTWLYSPMETMSWIYFVIWILPIAISLLINYQEKVDFSSKTSLSLLSLGLLFSFLGTLASFNALQHLGLAFSLASLISETRLLFLWIPFAGTWMPSFSWFSYHFFPEYTNSVRISLALIGFSWSLLVIYYKKNKALTNLYKGVSQ